MRYSWSRSCKFSDLLGKTLTRIDVTKDTGDDEIRFICEEGTFIMCHDQDCCESVTIESIESDIQSLVGNVILKADERSQRGESDWGTSTWTFYSLATIKGYVDIRWFGESNGYYSESVDMYFYPAGEEIK